jgi:RNA polymerase sigma-70 factor, ECF subfamily
VNLKALPSFFGFRPRESVETGEAFVRRVHDAHADFVFRTLQRFGVRDADLDDMTQEVFLIVLRKRDTYDREVKVTTWLYGIAMRVAAGHRRRAWVRREEPTDVLPAGTSGDTPETALTRAQDELALEEVLMTLAIEPRAIFVMYEVEGMSAAEIADVVGVPVGTVHSRLHHARKRFQIAAERRRQREERGTP